jgi:hypothetical protein
MATFGPVDPPVEERTTPMITGTVKDHLGNVIPGASLTTLELTLTEARTGEVINGREDFDIKEFVDEDGLLEFQLTQDDVVLVGDVLPGAVQTLIALIVGTYNSGVGRFMDRLLIPVVNEPQV